MTWFDNLWSKTKELFGFGGDSETKRVLCCNCKFWRPPTDELAARFGRCTKIPGKALEQEDTLAFIEISYTGGLKTKNIFGCESGEQESKIAIKEAA